jgi:hypothetical protein
MLIDGKIDGAWLGFRWLQDWHSLSSSWERSLLILESSLTRFIFSWAQWLVRTLGLRL